MSIFCHYQLKPSEIVAAKTNVLLITEYFIVAIIGLIPLTIYGILTSASILLLYFNVNCINNISNNTSTDIKFTCINCYELC